MLHRSFGLFAALHLNRAEKVPGMEDLNEASRESAAAKLQEMAAHKGDKKGKVRERETMGRVGGEKKGKVHLGGERSWPR